MRVAGRGRFRVERTGLAPSGGAGTPRRSLATGNWQLATGNWQLVATGAEGHAPVPTARQLPGGGAGVTKP